MRAHLEYISVCVCVREREREREKTSDRERVLRAKAVRAHLEYISGKHILCNEKKTLEFFVLRSGTNILCVCLFGTLVPVIKDRMDKDETNN